MHSATLVVAVCCILILCHSIRKLRSYFQDAVDRMHLRWQCHSFYNNIAVLLFIVARFVQTTYRASKAVLFTTFISQTFAYCWFLWIVWNPPSKADATEISQQAKMIVRSDEFRKALKKKIKDDKKVQELKEKIKQAREDPENVRQESTASINQQSEFEQAASSEAAAVPVVDVEIVQDEMKLKEMISRIREELIEVSARRSLLCCSNHLLRTRITCGARCVSNNFAISFRSIQLIIFALVKQHQSRMSSERVLSGM